MLALLFAFTLHLPTEHPGGDSWFGADKAKHFFMSAFVQSVGYTGARAAGLSKSSAMAAASTATAVVGIGKEIHDYRRGGEFSIPDLSWDAAGGLAAGAMLSRTRD